LSNKRQKAKSQHHEASKKGKIEFMKRFWLIFPALSALLLGGCSLLEGDSAPIQQVDPAFVDPAWLEGDPCEPPCWNGLVLEQSRPEEVYELARRSAYYVEERIEDHQSCGIVYVENGQPVQGPGRCIWLRCEGVQDQGCAMLSFKDERLVSTLLIPLNPPDLEEVAARYGPPQAFLVTSGQRAYTCQVQAFWPDQQMTVISSLNDRTRCRNEVAPAAAAGLLPADLPATQVLLHQPGFVDYSSAAEFLGFDQE
jgi:hypothetical protein